MRARAVRCVRRGTAIALSCTALGMPARAQSLADVARAEAERRKSITQPGRIYTNKDLKPVRSPAPTGSATAAHPQQADDADRSPPREEGAAHGESWWRARLADARERAERHRLFADALQSRVNALTTDVAARDDPAARAVVRTDLDRTLAELERVRGELAAQERALADLEEEARRAGVPPGWLR
jgi:hypothetical protein